VPEDVEFKALLQHQYWPWPILTYGNKHAIVLSVDNKDPVYYVMQSASTAQNSRREFAALWDIALPLGSSNEGLINEKLLKPVACALEKIASADRTFSPKSEIKSVVGKIRKSNG